jgi:hypothetical protein
MTETLVEIIPFIIGSAIAPGQIIIILLLLKSPQSGLGKAILFLLGVTSIRLLQGIVFGVILNLGASAEGTNGKGPVVSTLLLVLGIFLLITAYKKITKEQDPEDSPPKWITSIETATKTKLFTFGMQLPLISPKMWVFILGAIGTISHAQLGQPTSFFTFLVFIILAQMLLILPIIIRLLLPKRSMKVFQSASVWLSDNNRIILIVISLIFGIFFLYQGIYGLFIS